MYDIIIIGAGTAGISAYKEAIKTTQNIRIVNDGPWDTTCARVGCMPSKVLISSANLAYNARTSEQLGLKISSQIDTKDVMQHLQQLRDRFTKATLKDVNSWPTAHKISGRATFVNANTINVNNKKYQAKSFIIAVGSRPTVNQDWQQKLGHLYLTSDQVFEIPTLPKSLAVIGSGVIAIELAQAMQRLGVETTVFARSKKIGSLTSLDLQTLAQEIFSKELNIKYEILPEQVEKLGEDKVQINFIENGSNQSIEVDYLLSATGRTTNLDTLNIQHINDEFIDLKKLPVDPTTKQLGDYPIYIVGDAFTATPIQHEASYEGKLAVHNCLDQHQSSHKKSLTPLGIMFSSPEMAGIGSNYHTLRKANHEFVTGIVSYEKQGRAIVNGQNIGAVEVYVDRHSRKLLGAEFLCYSAEHLAHLLAWAISSDLTVDEILDHPFYHPTLEEGLRTALKHARRQL